MNEVLLSIEDLSICIDENKSKRQVLYGVSFTLRKNQILGLVGHSGAGKSMTMNAICGLLPDEARIVSGKIVYHESQDILKLDRPLRQKYCTQNIAIILQNSINALNPYEKIRKQLKDTFLLHHPENRRNMDEHIKRSLLDVGLEFNDTLLDKYPRHLSGGMRQRIAIVMALYSNVRILIADEPTTALDTVNQKTFLSFLKKLCITKNISMIYISHNLGLVEYLCEDVLIMNQGRIVEHGSVDEVFSNPSTAYTNELVVATSRLLDIKGSK